MLTINIEESELFNEETMEFIYIKPCVLHLEHSLISISKWESKYKKSFTSTIHDPGLTGMEFIDYVRCMTLNKNVDSTAYYGLNKATRKKIIDYINDPMTATVIRDLQNKRRVAKEIVTSELVYYWMIKLQMPVELLEKWHFNRLLTLIKVFNAKDNPKKMSKQEIMARNAEINKARRAKLHSKG